MVKKVFIHVCILVLLLYAIRFFLYTGLKQNEQGLFKKFSVMFLEKNNYDNLFIGSSRAECHFNPLIFDSINGFNSYNIGVSGSNNAFTYAILKAYLHKSYPPKQIIFNLDFHFSHESSDTIYEFPRFFPFLENHVLYKELKKRDPRFFMFKYFPFFSLPQMNDKYLNWCIRGYINKPSPYDCSGEKGNLKISSMEYKNLDELDTTHYKGLVLKENLDYLDSIVQLSKKVHARLILVVSPTFISGINRITNFPQHIKRFSDFARKNDILFIDYSTDTMCFQKKWFADFYHMKPEGCDAFTLKFSQDYKRSNVE